MGLGEDVTLREATPADLAGVLELYEHLSASNAGLGLEAARPSWAALMASDLTTVVVAETGGELVATCLLVIVPNLSRQARSFAVIENVVTHAGHRRKGLGAAVLHLAMDKAWAAGCYKIMLSTGRTDEEVMAFYEGVGFKRNTRTSFEARRI
jgi:GNAT superfamily N-acetyltransferase